MMVCHFMFVQQDKDNKIIMKDIDWRDLTRVQDDLVKQEDSRKKERQNYHKFLYKNELQKMMSQKRNTQRLIKQQQKRTYNEAYKSLDHDINYDNKSKRLYTLVKQNSNYNYSTTLHRKSRQVIEQQEGKQAMKERFRRVETEEYFEREKESLEKERKRKELAQFYENQINNTTSKKYLQRLENRRFQELAKEVQAQRQHQRLNNLNKIKFGYSQNPEIFDSIKTIYDKTQQTKQSLLKKLQAPNTNEKQAQRRSRQKIQHQINQTSKFNRNCFIEKQLRKQQHLLRTIEDDNNKIIIIQQQLTEENQQEYNKRKMVKFNLRTELEGQIHNTQGNRVKWNKMNENEVRINQPYAAVVQPVSIPGLYKDYKDTKRQEIIEKFLVNQKYSLPGTQTSKILSK